MMITSSDLWFGTCFFFSIQLGISSCELTNSIIFERGRAQPPTSSPFAHLNLHSLLVDGNGMGRCLQCFPSAIKKNVIGPFKHEFLSIRYLEIKVKMI